MSFLIHALSYQVAAVVVMKGRDIKLIERIQSVIG